LYSYIWFLQDKDQFLKMSRLNDRAKLKAGGWMLREILRNLLAYLVTLSVASFPLIPIEARTHESPI